MKQLKIKLYEHSRFVKQSHLCMKFNLLNNDCMKYACTFSNWICTTNEFYVYAHAFSLFFLLSLNCFKFVFFIPITFIQLSCCIPFFVDLFVSFKFKVDNRETFVKTLRKLRENLRFVLFSSYLWSKYRRTRYIPFGTDDKTVDWKTSPFHYSFYCAIKHNQIKK